MEREVFRFKRFSVAHGLSSMKVGVDAVLLGAWVNVEQPRTILDVGTGCGVIAMILAQNYPGAEIKAIDIDDASVEEAAYNFRNSEFRDRMSAEIKKFPQEIVNKQLNFDLIVSNPPYFLSGIEHPSTAREKARHQDSLSVFSLLNKSGPLLSRRGKLAMIFPAEFREDVMKTASEAGFFLQRECFVRNKPSRPEKRLMTEFGLSKPEAPATEHLTLFENEEPTEDYLKLCKDLYLRF